MQQDKRKKTILLTIVTLTTLVLGAIAVVTALRLRDLASKPVAPNAPESKPLAAPAGTVSINGCYATLVVPPQTCGDTCNTNADCASQGSITLQCLTVGGTKSCVNPACSSNTTTCVCLEPSATPTLTPSPSPTLPPGVTPSVTPTPTMTLIPSPTPSPTLTITPSPTLTGAPTATPTPMPTATPIPQLTCNGICAGTGSTGATCGSGYVCDTSTNRCRNAQCTAQENCACPGVTPSVTPTPSPTVRVMGPTNTPAPTTYIAQVPSPTPVPQLPTAGVNMPGLVVLTGGMILLIVGLAGVWLW